MAKLGFCEMVDDQHGAPALAGLGSAHHSGGACADHHNVKLIQVKSSRRP
jgi:hypothetical protein